MVLKTPDPELRGRRLGRRKPRRAQWSTPKATAGLTETVGPAVAFRAMAPLEGNGSSGAFSGAWEARTQEGTSTLRACPKLGQSLPH